MKLSELRQQGYKALAEALGTTGMIRFLQQLDAGYGDYTQERQQWLEQLSMEDFQKFVNEHRSQDFNNP